jgi:hypothetical protein
MPETLSSSAEQNAFVETLLRPAAAAADVPKRPLLSNFPAARDADLSHSKASQIVARDAKQECDNVSDNKPVNPLAPVVYQQLPQQLPQPQQLSQLPPQLPAIARPPSYQLPQHPVEEVVSNQQLQQKKRHKVSPAV